MLYFYNVLKYNNPKSINETLLKIKPQEIFVCAHEKVILENVEMEEISKIQWVILSF
jgi:hypothetical protein